MRTKEAYIYTDGVAVLINFIFLTLQPLLDQSDSENIFAFRSHSVTNSSMIEEHSDEIDGSHNFNDNESNEEFLRVLDELEVKKRQCLNEQQRVTELEEQLHVISKCIRLG